MHNSNPVGHPLLNTATGRAFEDDDHRFGELTGLGCAPNSLHEGPGRSRSIAPPSRRSGTHHVGRVDKEHPLQSSGESQMGVDGRGSGIYRVLAGRPQTSSRGPLGSRALAPLNQLDHGQMAATGLSNSSLDDILSPWRGRRTLPTWPDSTSSPTRWEDSAPQTSNSPLHVRNGRCWTSSVTSARASTSEHDSSGTNDRSGLRTIPPGPASKATLERGGMNEPMGPVSRWWGWTWPHRWIRRAACAPSARG